MEDFETAIKKAVQSEPADLTHCKTLIQSVLIEKEKMGQSADKATFFNTEESSEALSDKLEIEVGFIPWIVGQLCLLKRIQEGGGADLAWDLLNHCKQLGCDLNQYQEEKFKINALHVAVIRTSSVLTECLLKAGAHVNQINAQGLSPLDNSLKIVRMQSQPEQFKVIQVLLEYGANPNQLSDKNEAPLYSLLRGAFYDYDKNKIWEGLLHAFIKNGCQLNLQDQMGNAALHYAYQAMAKFNLVEILVRSGADLNLKNKCGNTPESLLSQRYLHEKQNQIKEWALVQRERQEIQRSVMEAVSQEDMCDESDDHPKIAGLRL